MTTEEFSWEIARLQKELDLQKAKNNLVNCSLQVVDIRMQYFGVAASELKEKLIDAIQNAKVFLPLKDCLEAIGSSASRYYSWTDRKVK